MKKHLPLISFLLVTTSCVFAQLLNNPSWIRTTQVASSGTGVAGSPGFVAGVTNRGTTVSSLSGTLAPSGNNIAMVWFQDWYSAAQTPNTPTWKGSSTGVTLWTNGTWFGDGNGKWRVYILMNPSTGSGTAATSWSGNVDEACLYVAWFTNCSGFETAGTPNFLNTAGTITARSASQTKDLQLFFSAVGSDGETSTAGSGQTVMATNGGVGHSSFVSRKAGQANTADAIMHWDAAARGTLDNTKLTTLTKGYYGGYVDHSPYSRWSLVAGSNAYSWARPVVVDGVSYTGSGTNWLFGDEGAASARNQFEFTVVNGAGDSLTTNLAMAGFGVFAITNNTAGDINLDIWSMLPGSGGSWGVMQLDIAAGTSNDKMIAHSSLNGVSQGSTGYTGSNRKVYFAVMYLNLTGGVLTNYLYDPDSSFSLSTAQQSSVAPATSQATINLSVGYIGQIPGFVMFGDLVVLYDPTAQQVADLVVSSAGGYTSGTDTSAVTWGVASSSGAFNGGLIGY